MEYKVVSELKKDDFERAVNDLLSRGWTLVGGVCRDSIVVKDGGGQVVGSNFTQALVKVSEAEKDRVFVL